MIKVTQYDYSKINDVLSQLYDYEREGIFDYDDGDFVSCCNYVDYAGGELATGASKVVYMPPQADFVVKVPITGSIQSVYDEDTDEYLEDDEEIYDGFRTSSYCEDEMFLYEEAKVLGINEFFPEIMEIETILEEKVFAQEKVTPLYAVVDLDILNSKIKDEIDSKAKLQSKDVRQSELKWFDDNMLGYLSQVTNREIIFALIEQYGIDKVRKLNTLCKLHGINDIEDRNVGVNKNGKIVIFDYSGWNC
jgi:hypothetical protein